MITLVISSPTRAKAARVRHQARFVLGPLLYPLQFPPAPAHIIVVGRSETRMDKAPVITSSQLNKFPALTPAQLIRLQLAKQLWQQGNSLFAKSDSVSLAMACMSLQDSTEVMLVLIAEKVKATRKKDEGYPGL